MKTPKSQPYPQPQSPRINSYFSNHYQQPFNINANKAQQKISLSLSLRKLFQEFCVNGAVLCQREFFITVRGNAIGRRNGTQGVRDGGNFLFRQIAGRLQLQRSKQNKLAYKQKPAQMPNKSPLRKANLSGSKSPFSRHPPQLHQQQQQQQTSQLNIYAQFNDKYRKYEEQENVESLLGNQGQSNNRIMNIQCIQSQFKQCQYKQNKNVGAKGNKFYTTQNVLTKIYAAKQQKPNPSPNPSLNINQNPNSIQNKQNKYSKNATSKQSQLQLQLDSEIEKVKFGKEQTQSQNMDKGSLIKNGGKIGQMKFVRSQALPDMECQNIHELAYNQGVQISFQNANYFTHLNHPNHQPQPEPEPTSLTNNNIDANRNNKIKQNQQKIQSKIKQQSANNNQINHSEEQYDNIVNPYSKIEGEDTDKSDGKKGSNLDNNNNSNQNASKPSQQKIQPEPQLPIPQPQVSPKSAQYARIYAASPSYNYSYTTQPTTNTSPMPVLHLSPSPSPSPSSLQKPTINNIPKQEKQNIGCKLQIGVKLGELLKQKEQLGEVSKQTHKQINKQMEISNQQNKQNENHLKCKEKQKEKEKYKENTTNLHQIQQKLTDEQVCQIISSKKKTPIRTTLTIPNSNMDGNIGRVQGKNQVDMMKGVKSFQPEMKEILNLSDLDIDTMIKQKYNNKKQKQQQKQPAKQPPQAQSPKITKIVLHTITSPSANPPMVCHSPIPDPNFLHPSSPRANATPQSPTVAAPSSSSSGSGPACPSISMNPSNSLYTSFVPHYTLHPSINVPTVPTVSIMSYGNINNNNNNNIGNIGSLYNKAL